MKPTDQHRENETLAGAIERLAQEKAERDPLLTDQGKIKQRTDEPELIPGQITGEMLLSAAEAMIGRQPYVLGADSPLVQGDNYTGSTDCAEFCTERVEEVTGKIYGALRPYSSNPEPWTGAWFNDMKAGRVIQIPVEQAKRIPGAILLRYDKRVHHIVFVGHNRTTVEAKGRNHGVVRDEVDSRGFQYGILIPGVVYKEVV